MDLGLTPVTNFNDMLSNFARTRINKGLGIILVDCFGRFLASNTSAELLSQELKAWLDEVILPILLQEMLND
jgi:hypothetical protein